MCRLARDRTLDHLDAPANESALGHSICCSQGLHLDDADTGVILTAVVCAVAQVTEPSLEGWSVVFLDKVAVGDDARGAGDAGPTAVRGAEGDVDVGVGFEVVGLARFGVCVEEEVDTTALLF